jgi:hypothetical protein
MYHNHVNMQEFLAFLSQSNVTGQTYNLSAVGSLADTLFCEVQKLVDYYYILVCMLMMCEVNIASARSVLVLLSESSQYATTQLDSVSVG